MDAMKEAPTIWAVKNYKEVFWLFEAGRAIEVTWTRWPVDRNSTAYRRLMATTAGHSAFCVFNGIIRLVSRERTGGLLTVKGEPMSAEDLHAETGIKIRVVSKGLAMLQSPAIGWLVPAASTDGLRAVNGFKPSDKRHPLACARSVSISSSSGSSPPEEGVGETAPPRQSDFAPPNRYSGNWDAGTLGRIVQAYPKRVARAPAMRAVDAALCRLAARGEADPPAWLQARVEAFAAACKGTTARFVPNPAKWCDDERYDDDDGAWIDQFSAKESGPTTAIGKGGF